MASEADRDARFSTFVRTQSETLLRTAYLLTRNGPDAEELVQDSLVWLYPRWNQVEDAEHQTAYVRKAMVNRFLASRRRMSATEIRFGEGLDALVDRGTPGRDATVDVDERDQLWRVMGELNERQRAALVLRFFHDLPDDEVAGVLDCRVGTVRSLISRGLARLRETGTFAEDTASNSYLRNVT